MSKPTGLLDVEGTAGSTITINAVNPTAVTVTISGPNQPKGNTFNQTFSGPVLSIIVNEPQGGTNSVNLVSSVATTLNGGTGADSFKVTLTGSGSEAVVVNGNGPDVLVVAGTTSTNRLGLASGRVALQNTSGPASETVNYSGLASLGISSAGPQIYGAPVTLNTTTTVTTTSANNAGAITFASTIDGSFGLTANASGALNVAGAVGSLAPLSSLVASASTAVHLDGGSVATSGAQTYSAAVVVGAAGSLTGFAISFASTVDGAAALAVTANGGDVNFAGAVGGTTRLSGLTVRNARNVTAAGIAAGFLAQTAGTGTTSLGGTVNTNAAGGVALTTNVINVNAPIAATAAGAVIFNNAGPLTIAPVANINAAGAVIQSGRGVVAMQGSIRTTGGAVSFATPVTLTGPLSIATFGGAVSFSRAITGGAGTDLSINAGAGDVAFFSTVDGAFALAITSAGTSTFGAAVGGAAPLSRVVTDATGRTLIAAGMNAAGDLTFNDPVVLAADVTLTDAGPSSTGIAFNSTVDGAHALTVKSNRPKVFQASIGSITPLSALTTAVVDSSLPTDPTQINAPVVATTGDQNYTDAVILGTATAFNAGGSVVFSGAVTATAGSHFAISVTGGANASSINLSGATVNAHVQLNNNGTGTQAQNVAIALGHGTNTFSLTPPAGAIQGAQGGGNSFTGDAGAPPRGAAIHVSLLDNGGYNLIDLTQAPLGVALDLGLNDGNHPQSIYQPALRNPNLEEQAAIAGFTSSAVSALQQSSLNLQGNFQEVVGTRNNLLFAAPPPSAPSSDLTTFLSGSLIVLTGGSNVVYGAPGATILSFSGGNQVVGNTTTVDESRLSAYLSSTNTAAQAYLSASSTGQLAYIVQNATGLSQYLATNSTAQQAFLANSSTAVVQFIAGSTAGQQAFLSQNSDALSQYIASNVTAQQAYLAGNSTAVSAYIANNFTAQQAYLAANSPSVSAYIAGNVPAQQAYLAQGSAALSAYIAFSPTGLGAYQASNQYLSDAAAQNAFANAGAAGLASYLLNSANGALQAYISGNTSVLAQFLNLSPTGIQAYLTASSAGETAYLQQNATAVAQYLATNLTAQQAYLAGNSPSVSAYIAGSTTTQLAYLAKGSAALSAYIAFSPTGLAAYQASSQYQNDLAAQNAFATAGAGGLVAYLQNSSNGALQAYISGNTSVLAQFLNLSPTGIQGYLTASNAGETAYLQQNATAFAQFALTSSAAQQGYLVQNATALAQYIASNAAAQQAFLAGNTPAVTSYILSNASALGAFLSRSEPALQAYAQGGTSSLQAYFQTNPSAISQYITANPDALFQYLASDSAVLQQYTANNPSVLQQYLAGSTAALQQYVATNPTALAQYLASSPTLVQQYLAGSPSTLAQFLTTSPSALIQYVLNNSSALAGFLAANTTLLQQYVSANPSTLAQFLTSANALSLAQYIGTNPSVLAQFLATDPNALAQYVGTNPSALVQYLGANPSTLVRYLTDNPNVLQQYLTQNAAAFQQYLNQNPSLLQQILASAVLDLFRMRVNVAGTGNQVTGGLLSSFNMGSGLFEEALDAGQLAMVQSGVVGGISPAAYALNVTMAPGPNVIVGGLLGNFTSQGGDTRFVIADPSVLGLPSGTVIPSAIFQSPGSGGVFKGGGGNDTFYFVGGGSGNAFGHVALAEPPGNAFDTIDLSNFQGGGASLNLNTTEQTVSASNLWLTLPSGQGITRVIGSPSSDTITANNLNDVLQGAALDVSHPRDLNGPAPSVPTQVVFLDFAHPQLDPSETLSAFDPGGVYSAADQSAILAGLQRIYAPFGSLVQFTLTQPASGPFETVSFNQTPIVDGQYQPGGHSSAIDFRNLNLADTVQLDINGFLGTALGDVPDTEANLVNLSITVAAHEVAHTLGVEHADSFGPIGFGISNPPGLGHYNPTYDGLVGAFQTPFNVIASPASVGSTLADAASGMIDIGERSAIILALIGGGVVVDGTHAANHTTAATALPVSPTGGLYTLNVPNPINTGFDAGKALDVAAVDLTDHVGGTQSLVVPDPKSPGSSLSLTLATPNYYTIYGQAGDLMNFKVMSAALARYQGNSIDSVLQIYDPSGNLIASNDDDFESSDSSIIDLLLKQTGQYTVAVSSFHATPDETFFLDPNDPNYNPAAYYGAELGNYELLVYRFNAYTPTTGSGANDNDTFILGTGAYTVDGGAGTNTIVATAPGSFTLSSSQLISPTNASSLANIQRAILTDSNATGGDLFTIDQSWTGTAILAGGGGTDSLATIGSLNGQVLVGNSLAAVAVNGDLARSLTIQGNVPSATIRGDLAGTFRVSATLGAATVGGAVTNTGVLAAGSVNSLTIGPGNALGLGHDMAGQITIAPTGSLGSLRVSGGAPGTIVADKVGTIGIYGGYGPFVLRVTEGGIQRLVDATAPASPYPNPVALAPPAPASPNPLPGVTFQAYYEGLASSLAPANPQLTVRVTNQSGSTANDQFDFTLATFNDQAKFNLARLDSASGAISGARNVVVEGDILSAVSQAASSFLGSAGTLAAGVALLADNLAGVAVRDFVPSGSIAAKSVQGVAFGLFASPPQNTVLNGASAQASDATRLLAGGTAIVTAGSLSAGGLETFRVPFADVNPVAFFFCAGANGGSFVNNGVLFSVQTTGSNIAPTASNLARGADTALVAILRGGPSTVQTIDVRGDNASIQTAQTVAASLCSSGPLGDLSVAGPLSAVITAPSIFGSVNINGGPLTGTIQTTGCATDPITGVTSFVPADIGRVYFTSGSSVPTVTAINSTGNGMTGAIICAGNLLSQVNASNGLTGVVEAQGNIGVIAGPPATVLGGVVTSAFSGTIVSLANIIGNIAIGGNVNSVGGNPLSGVIAANSSMSGSLAVNGSFGGEAVVLGTLSGNVTIKGGMKSGRLAARGGITGNVSVTGGIDSASALVSGAGIGSAALGTTLSVTGSNNGIIAALGPINVASPIAGFVFANAGNTINQAAVDAIFATGTSPLAPDLFDVASPLDLVLLKQILLKLQKLKVATVNGVNVLQDGP